MQPWESIDWLVELNRRAEPDLLTGVDPAWLEGLALDAVAKVLDTVPSVKTRLSAGRLSVRSFTRIVCDMVLRVVRNPEGLRSESDGTYQYTSAATVASGDLWIPEKDLVLLRGPVARLVPASVRLGTDRGWSR
jgi:hypothetical protein